MDRLKGIIVPMVTPLDRKRKIDYQGTARLVEHVIKGGVHAIFVLGTTGESQSLSIDDRKQFVSFVGNAIAGRVPYLVCVTDTSIEDACCLALRARESGACAVVAAPPYYFSPSQKDMVNWYVNLADHSPLPLFLYNMPGNVKVSIAPSTVRILSSHPNIWGIKDSSADMSYFQAVKYLTGDVDNFSMYVGPEELTGECVLMGADGGVNGGANMFPELYVKMYEVASRGDIPEVRRLQNSIMKISTSIYTVGNCPSSYLQGLKCALELMGLCEGGLALPYVSVSDDGRERIRAALQSINQSEWK